VGPHTLSPAKGPGECCKLPQQVRAEPGRQTVCDKFWTGDSNLYCIRA